MKKPLLVIGLLIAILYACNHGDRTIHKLLSPGKLPAQTFVINITRDTVLTTKKGALIRIPKGALKADKNTVKLEVKEAYSMEDIVKGGLTTTSNGKPLSSGGMFYINPVGDNNVTIVQPLSIATPTAFLDSNMQLFKGDVQGDSTINWTDPKPMPGNPQLNAIIAGRRIFNDNCASCHDVNRDLTGPMLAGAMQRLLPVHNGDKKGIYDFVRNPYKVMPRIKYYQDLKTKFGGAMMTSFALSDTELDCVFAYIENESNRTFTLLPEDSSYNTCRDSCTRYYQEMYKLSNVKSELESKPLVEEKVRFPNDTSSEDIELEIPADTNITADDAWEGLKTVSPSYNTSFYYQFTIDSFGWHNIDCYTNIYADILKASNLRVKLAGEYKENISIYLILPSVKTYIPGGLLENKNDEYGFDEVDGSIPLPQGIKAYIIAVGEQDGDALFGKKEFNTQRKQVFELSLKKLNKEALQQELANLHISGLTIEAKKTNTKDELKNVDKELKGAEQLRPKNCNCDSFPQPPESVLMINTGYSIEGADY